MKRRGTNAQHWVLCKWGLTFVQSAAVHIPAFVRAGQATLGISS